MYAFPQYKPGKVRTIFVHLIYSFIYQGFNNCPWSQCKVFSRLLLFSLWHSCNCENNYRSHRVAGQQYIILIKSAFRKLTVLKLVTHTWCYDNGMSPEKSYRSLLWCSRCIQFCKIENIFNVLQTKLSQRVHGSCVCHFSH